MHPPPADAPFLMVTPMETPDVEDAVLATAARLDRRAFTPLYERYVGPIYRYCYHRLNSREAAEDATSQVFTRALTAISRFQTDSGSFRSWLFVIAHNIVIDLHRQQRPATSLTLIDPPAAAASPEHEVLAAQERTELTTLLAGLPTAQRQVMELRLSGLTSPEVATVLGTTPTAVRSLQFRAVATLRAKLTSHDTTGGHA
jgi:RNA polymerase sigma-70 factor, ECF subfamily